jgi:hypothetical protein
MFKKQIARHICPEIQYLDHPVVWIVGHPVATLTSGGRWNSLHLPVKVGLTAIDLTWHWTEMVWMRSRVSLEATRRFMAAGGTWLTRPVCNLTTCLTRSNVWPRDIQTSRGRPSFSRFYSETLFGTCFMASPEVVLGIAKEILLSEWAGNVARMVWKECL